MLDQFEELFTLGRQNETSKARAAAFLDDLAGLVENRPPAAIRQRIEADPAAGREFDFARASFRLLISLREDFLPDFESLMPQLTKSPKSRLNSSAATESRRSRSSMPTWSALPASSRLRSISALNARMRTIWSIALSTHPKDWMPWLQLFRRNAAANTLPSSKPRWLS